MVNITSNTLPPEDQTGDISVFLAGVDDLTFPVGLEGIVLDLPSRAVITQAFDGIWADTLGSGVKTMTLTGTTGWRRIDGTHDGREQLHRLINIHNSHMEQMKGGANDSRNWLMITDHTLGGATYKCIAMDLKITRDKSRTTLFAFEWQLTVMEWNYLKAKVVPSTKKSDRPSKTITPGQARKSTAAYSGFYETNDSVPIDRRTGF